MTFFRKSVSFTPGRMYVAVKHPRWEPSALNKHACAGGVRDERPYCDQSMRAGGLESG